MRLHTLIMTGIGPYAGTETIDFDRFTASGRFLLTGPTGSGKTTIIDAIVFALYGQVADSSGSSKQRLRSTLVDAAARSEVDLTFSTSAGVYRILRSPEYWRPKKRGTGTTRQNAAAKLWRLSAPGGHALDEPITRLEDVGAEVNRIVGLSRDQFTQTVVLPQGRFARFLRATSAERHTLLRDVFGTGVFDAIQAEIAERNRLTDREAQAARQALQARVEVAAPLLALLPIPSADDDPPPGALSATIVTDDAQKNAEPFPAPRRTELSEAPESAELSEPAELSELAESAELAELAQLAELAGAPVPDTDAIAAIGEQALARSRAALAPLAEAVERARAEAGTAHAATEAAVELRQRLDRREALLAEQAELDAHRAAHDADTARLDAARRASQVTTALHRHARALRDLAAARDLATQALSRTLNTVGASASATSTILTDSIADSTDDTDSTDTQDIPAIGPILEECEAILTSAPQAPYAPEDSGESQRLQHAESQLTALATRTRTLAGSLEPLVALEADLGHRRAALERDQALLDTRRADLDEHIRALEARPARHAELETALETARQAENRLPQARVDRDAALARRDAAIRAEALDTRLAASKQAVVEATEVVESAKAHAAAQHRAWLEATAGSIVAELVDGEPCPVCGSPEHPAPADPEAGSVSRAQVEQVDAERARADEHLTERVREHSDLEREHRTALEASGMRPLAELDGALAGAAEHLQSLARASRPLSELTEQLAGFAKETAAMRDALETDRTALAEDRARLEAAQNALEQDRARCADACGEHATVAARHHALLGIADAAESARSHLAAVRTAAREATSASDDLGKALAAAGFTTASQAEQAILPAAELTALAEAVDRIRADRERVRHALTEDPRICALTGEETADVAGARRLQEAAEKTRETALAAHATASEAHRHLEEALEAVDRAAVRLADILAGSRALTQVAALVTGRNDASTPLATWVLLDRFAEVLVFANDRLTQMSSGRYELVRVADETGSAGRRDRGLGLGVIDRLCAGVVRDPKTLSGGETFYVSLSLALALADVVTAESGGVAMETLFVDEGFGTLDPETLQTVLAELGRLQAGGRTVGIVSHIEELRRQVPDRIEVTTTPVGSTLRITAS
ncbi:SMC family ATPase [Actinomyces massiliensis]|uniref:SMC family ATPase n=1 Tax=Actinomyces massiliensis TaxID=461393 RepID=UPI0028EAB9D0|nr:SMC family ATPase [Actinomyces massiliensis]